MTTTRRKKAAMPKKAKSVPVWERPSFTNAELLEAACAAADDGGADAFLAGYRKHTDAADARLSHLVDRIEDEARRASVREAFGWAS